MSLTDEQIESVYRDVWSSVTHSKRLVAFARAIESAATAPLLERIAEFVAALDEEKVVSHIGVFNTEDDPRKAIKDLMLWSQGVGEYFAGEKAKERIAELEALRKDAERYRWLKANCGFGIRKNGVNELSVAFYEMQPDNINELDASIDAAKESS